MSVTRSFDDPPAYCLTTSLETQRSHVTDLLAAGVRAEVDHDALTRYLLDWSSWGELFKHVRPLLPGTEIDVAEGRVRTDRRFPKPFAAEWLDEPLDALTLQLRHHLLAAAAWAAGSTGIVGVLVGGVDSSGVLSALAQVVPTHRIRALCITGEPGDGDTDPDAPYVADLCRHLGVKLITDLWTPERSPTEKALLTDSRPAFAPYHPLDRLLDGVDTVLSATGGDAIFGGNFDELGTRIPKAPLASIQTLCANVPWGARLRERGSWLAGRVWRRLPRSRPKPGHFGPRLQVRRKRQTAPATPHGRLRDYYMAPPIETGHLHMHALMQRFSLPYRDVVLHSDLVRFLASVPIESLNCDGRFRGLYHRAISAWVPRSIAERRTKSYYDPFLNLPPTTKRVLRDLAHGQRLEEFGYADGAKLLAEYDRGEINGIWNFLTVEAFLRAHT